MPSTVSTKDTTALSDAELAEMADLAGMDTGVVSKTSEEWVLITQTRDAEDRLAGFSFATLERIGGTPCVLVGLAYAGTGPGKDPALTALMGDQLRRAVLAFPDEDVLVGTCLVGPSGFAAFDGLHDVVPRPGHKASGEERAWGRRLAKRFGAEGRVDDRSFVVTGVGEPAPMLVNQIPDEADSDGQVSELFATVDPERHDRLIAFGWAMAEDLAARSAR
ncbi:MAG: hypothetical protein ACT4OS_02090 [Acidimicrobiales bacterium]